MRLVIAGGTGLIGRNLADTLVQDGHEVVILTRSEGRLVTGGSIRFVTWDGEALGPWAREVDGARAVVNLAGVSIAGENLMSVLFGRWTQARKEAIRRSRVASGKVLAEAIRQAGRRPAVFIQASGVGYYGVQRTSACPEDTPPGADYLASVTVDWEAASAGVLALGVRHVVVRSGVVLTPEGGILPMVALPFRLMVGGPLGNGRQAFPWIHIQDETAAVRFLIENSKAEGPFNLAAPGLLTNADFGRALGRALGRPYYFPTPALLLRAMLGEKATLVLEGQQPVPTRLSELGFTFRFPTAEEALRDLYA